MNRSLKNRAPARDVLKFYRSLLIKVSSRSRAERPEIFDKLIF